MSVALHPRRSRRSLALVSVVLAVLLGLGSCAREETILAVNDWKLSRSDFVSTLDQIAKNPGYVAARSRNGQPFKIFKDDSPTEFAPDFVTEFLNERVTFQLAEAELVKRKIAVTDDDRRRAVEVIEGGLTPGSAPSVTTGSTPGSTPGTAAGPSVLDGFGSYREVLINGVASLQVLQRSLTADISSDAGLRQLYDKLKDQVATQACVRHLLVRAGAEQEPAADGTVTAPTDSEFAAALITATGLQGQLVGGADFAALAQASSGDKATASKGGDLGCATKGTYDPSFDDAVWAQPVGQVGAPVKTVYGYHLILVTERRVRSFDEVKDKLVQAVAAQGEQALQEWLTSASKVAKVVVDPVAGVWNAVTGVIDPPGGATKVTLVPDDGRTGSTDLTTGTTPRPPGTTPAVPGPTAGPTVGGAR